MYNFAGIAFVITAVTFPFWAERLVGWLAQLIAVDMYPTHAYTVVRHHPHHR